MNRYQIEILSDRPPSLLIGDSIGGGQVVAIKSNEPDFVGATWLSSKTGLSKSTIIAKLANIAQGTQGKKLYPRLHAMAILADDKPKMGRPRKN